VTEPETATEGAETGPDDAKPVAPTTTPTALTEPEAVTEETDRVPAEDRLAAVRAPVERDPD